MVLTELRSLLDKYMSAELDGYDGLSPNDTQRDAVLNRALRKIGLSLYLYRSVPLSLSTNDQVIPLSDVTKFEQAMLGIDHMFLDGTALRDQTRKYGLWSSDYFQRWYPAADSASAGVPVAATIIGDALKFNCPVNSATATAGGVVVGRCLPRILVATDDEWIEPTDIPEHLHEIIAILAAIEWSIPNLTVSEQYEKVQLLSAEAIPLLIREFSRQFKMIHARDPEKDELRQACAVYKMTERSGGNARNA